MRLLKPHGTSHTVAALVSLQAVVAVCRFTKFFSINETSADGVVQAHRHHRHHTPFANIMNSLYNAFVAPSRAGDAWFRAGPVSSFPDIAESGSSVLAEDMPMSCSRRRQPLAPGDATSETGPEGRGNGQALPGCRVFHVPKADSSRAVEVPLDAGEPRDDDDGEDEAEGDGGGGANDAAKAARARRLEDEVLVFRYKGKFHAVDHVS
jgi:hypothetical protein